MAVEWESLRFRFPLDDRAVTKALNSPASRFWQPPHSASGLFQHDVFRCFLLKKAAFGVDAIEPL